MKQYWQRENEALERLGFVGIEADPVRQRAVDVVIELMREIEKLNNKTTYSSTGESDWD